MGMFDIVVKEQIKCFYVPMLDIKVENKRVYFYTSGGSLKYYDLGDSVPWQTPYYNYGKDFAIFDYSNMLDTEPQIIIVKDGKISKAYKYNKVPNRTKFSTVINNFGCPIKVSKPRDCVDIVEEYRFASDLFQGLRRNYSNSPKFLTDSHTQSMQEFGRIKKLSFENFENKWLYTEKSEEYQRFHDNTKMGFVISELIRSPEKENIILKAYRAEITGKKREIKANYKKWLKNNNITEYDVFVNKI